LARINYLRAWVFKPLPENSSAIEVIVWWESRRLFYNIFTLGIGFISFLVMVFFMATSNLLRCQDVGAEPILMLAAPIFINICYTLGWIVECAARPIKPLKRRFKGPLLLRIGLGFSLFVVLLPTVLWGCFWLGSVVKGNAGVPRNEDGCLMIYM